MSPEPCYDVIKALRKVGFVLPEDRKWKELDIVIDNKAFIKYTCPCLKNEIIEVILKPFCYSVHKETYTYYIGQCPRCETVYWVRDE